MDMTEHGKGENLTNRNSVGLLYAMLLCLGIYFSTTYLYVHALSIFTACILLVVYFAAYSINCVTRAVFIPPAVTRNLFV